MSRAVEAGLAKYNHDLALWSIGAADPPLMAIDDVVVALALDSRADVGGVRRCHTRLSHGEARANFSVE